MDLSLFTITWAYMFYLFQAVKKKIFKKRTIKLDSEVS